MDLKILIIAVLSVVAMGALALVAIVPSQKDKANKRVASLRASKPGRRGTSAGQAESQNKERRRKLQDSLDALDDKKKSNKKKKQISLDQMLEQAGLPIGRKEYYIASAMVALIFCFIGIISGQQLWVTGLILMVGGLGFPRWVVNFLRKRRQKKFVYEFSNAIDVIVRGVKSGLPVNECLKIIARDTPRPVSDEFHMLTEGLRIGMTFEQALNRLYARMPLQEVNFFCIVLLIQQKAGGNLAEALSNLATVLRSRKLMEAKIKALSSEAKASAYIIGSLPFLVMGSVKLSSPEYLDPLFNTRMGNFILIGAGIWMLAGIIVMKKMTQIKV